MERMEKRMLKFRYEEDNKTLKPQVFGTTEEFSLTPSWSPGREITIGQDTVINSGDYQELYHSGGDMSAVDVRHSYRNNAAKIDVEDTNALGERQKGQ